MLQEPEDGVFILYLLLHSYILVYSWICARKHPGKAGFAALVSGVVACPSRPHVVAPGEGPRTTR